MESPEREREIAQSALAELLKEHKAAGFSLIVMAQSMLAVGAYTIANIVGGERAREIGGNVLDSAALRAIKGVPGADGKPVPENAASYVAAALNGAPPTLNRDAVFTAAIMHGAFSLVARRGADEVRPILTELLAEIDRGVADRALRSGDIARDYN